MTLTILEAIPQGLLECDAANLHTVLSGPTLIHLQGRHHAPLFVSVLLHGNETTGWDAVRRVLNHYRNRELPRAISIFIGNVAAAAEGLRVLDNQSDYNRVWNGGVTPEHQLMTEVIHEMQGKKPFASIDIHNNTGLNPHYACINYLDNAFLYLATLFSRTVVYFIRPQEVQSVAFGKICPAVTVECGKPGAEGGIEHAQAFIDAALHLDHFPEHNVSQHDYDLYHTIAVVKVPQEYSINFKYGDEDLIFANDLDHFNFCELPAGTIIADVNRRDVMFDVMDEEGKHIENIYFENDGEYLKTRRQIIPSMLTLDQRIIRQDCLCYLMERLSINLHQDQ